MGMRPWVQITLIVCNLSKTTIAGQTRASCSRPVLAADFCVHAQGSDAGATLDAIHGVGGAAGAAYVGHSGAA